MKRNSLGQFVKGQVPWNKNKHYHLERNSGMFIPGKQPKTTKPKGSIIKHKDGYYYIKVDDKKRWVTYHKYLWEQAHGKLPKGKVVIFLDRDQENLSLDNLEAVTRPELAQLNKQKLWSTDAEVTKLGLNTVRLMLKMNEKGKEGHRRYVV